MTTATIERYFQFIEKVTTDPEMSQKLEAIEPGNVNKILELAAANGFIFTADELKAYSREAKALTHAENDQLTEDQLELVAGGSWWRSALHIVRKAVDYLDDKINK